MPINTGGSPADIEGSYLVSPEILIASSRPNDDIGKEYSDITLIFSDQNNEDLTLVTKTFQGSQEGAGVGSFIVGDGNDFSVFTKVKTVDETYNDSILATQIYSGTLTSEGIKDMYVAFVLLDDYGDPNNRYVEIGDSRVFYDEDGFSEKVDEEKSVNINIQDVPIIVEGLTQGIFNDKLH